MEGKEIVERVSRKVDIEKGRVVLSPDAMAQLGIVAGDNEVVITTFEDKIVITKRVREEAK